MTRKSLSAILLCKRILQALKRNPEGLILGNAYDEKEKTLWKETFGKKEEILECVDFLLSLGLIEQQGLIYKLKTLAVTEHMYHSIREEILTHVKKSLDEFPQKR